MKRIYVDKYTGTIERTDVYLVKLTMKDGTVYENLEPRRLFPISNEKMYITLLNGEEKEAGFVRDFDELDEGSRRALSEVFAEYYRIPKITRMIRVEESFGALKWFVDTDRGEVSFRIRNPNSDIKQLYGTSRVIVRDSNDNRYEIPDVTALDAQSRRILFPFL